MSDEPLQLSDSPLEELAERVSRLAERLEDQAEAAEAQADVIVSLGARVEALETAIQSLLHGPATVLAVSITGGSQMGAGISIDDTAGKATFQWYDDHGDLADPPASADGAPITVTLASDNTGVATLAADPADPTGHTFDITPVALGDFNVTATAVDDAGAPAVFADGQPITAAPAPCSIVAGPAASLAVQANA